MLLKKKPNQLLFVGCCFQDLFKRVGNLLVQFNLSFPLGVSLKSYSIDTTTVWKDSHFSSFYISDIRFPYDRSSVISYQGRRRMFCSNHFKHEKMHEAHANLMSKVGIANLFKQKTLVDGVFSSNIDTLWRRVDRFYIKAENHTSILTDNLSGIYIY